MDRIQACDNKISVHENVNIKRNKHVIKDIKDMLGVVYHLPLRPNNNSIRIYFALYLNAILN